MMGRLRISIITEVHMMMNDNGGVYKNGCRVQCVTSGDTFILWNMEGVLAD
jgi:hypothetical protein